MTVLLPHQLDAARKMKNGCILKGATGSGKTLTALTYYSDTEPGQDLIIITPAKKRDTGDWQAEARLLGIFPEVDSWQNIQKYEDVTGAFFIFDEQRVVGSGPWVKSFLKIAKNNSWVLLTATPGDTWMDYIPVLIANGFYSSRQEFCNEHVVFVPFIRFPRVWKFLREQKLERILASILIEMPYEKHTVRHEIDVFCEYDREKYDLAWKRRWNFLEDRPIRNISEMCALLRRVINTDPTRLERVRDLLIKHPKMIIFYNFDYELEILRTLGEDNTWEQETIRQEVAPGTTGESSGLITATAGEHGYTSTIPKTLGSFAVAEWNGHKHEPVPETESWMYLVQYSAGAEGWNCTATDTIVFYSRSYSYRMTEQAKGRIDRLDTPFTDLYYYVFGSSATLDEKIAETLFSKKNFNERDFVEKSVSGGYV
jgi:hypothetical protein